MITWYWYQSRLVDIVNTHDNPSMKELNVIICHDSDN